jgi:hypothetical protein
LFRIAFGGAQRSPPMLLGERVMLEFGVAAGLEGFHIS